MNKRMMDVMNVDYNDRNQIIEWEKKCGVPHIIHACFVVPKEPLFPTHTHGRTAIGEPELFINARAFGPKGNVQMINGVHAHLKFNPDDKIKINSGQTVEFPIGDGMTICLRKVGADFQAVRNAYVGIMPKGMSFIQIYVKGDDFALTNEYYAAREPY